MITGAVPKLIAWESPGTGSTDGKEHTGEMNTHRRDPLNWIVGPAAFLCCSTSLGWYSWIVSPRLNPSSTWTLSRTNDLDSSEGNYEIPRSNGIFLEERFAMWKQTRTSKFISSRFSYCPPWMLECTYFSNFAGTTRYSCWESSQKQQLPLQRCQHVQFALYTLIFITVKVITPERLSVTTA